MPITHFFIVTVIEECQTVVKLAGDRNVTNMSHFNLQMDPNKRFSFMNHKWNGLFSVDACATGRLPVVHQCTLIV